MFVRDTQKEHKQVIKWHIQTHIWSIILQPLMERQQYHPEMTLWSLFLLSFCSNIDHIPNILRNLCLCNCEILTTL